MLLLRKLFFYFFALIYFIFCPLIILYALGIMVNPGKNEIIKTGILSLSSLPSGARVILNHRPLDGMTPTVIHNLTPGRYQVLMELNGYHAWEKEIAIKPKQAAAVEHVLLIPETWPTQIISQQPFKALVSLPGNPFVLVQDGPSVDNLYIYRWPQNFFGGRGSPEDLSLPMVPLFSHDFIYSGARVLSTYTREDSPYLLFIIEIKNKKKFLWIDLRDKKPHVNDVTDLFSEVPQDIRWDPQGRDLFVLKDGALSRMDVIEKAVFPKIAENICGYNIQRNNIYILRDNYVLEKLDLDGKTQMIFRKGPKAFPPFLGKKNEVRISIFKNDKLFILGKRGEFLFSRYPYGLVPNGVKGLAYHRETERLLFWTDAKIGILDLKESDADDDYGPPLRWVIQDGNNIRQAFWVNGGWQILFSEPEKVTLTEINPLYPSCRIPVTKIKRNSQIHYDGTSGRLYILNDEGLLTGVQILPLRNLPFVPQDEVNSREKAL